VLPHNLYELLLASSEAGITLQRSDGSMPAGHNGPWHDTETPVRNTAHWALTFDKAFEISGDIKFKLAAILCCDYLISKKNRPLGHTFYCRENGRARNNSNGLIGQAWAVEPLLVLGEKLQNQGYLDVVDEVLSLHPYHPSRHAWMDVEINGEPLSYNLTLNQSIWFGMMCYWAGKYNPRLKNRALNFFANLSNIAEFLEPGLLNHKLTKRDFRLSFNTVGRQYNCFPRVRRTSLDKPALLELSLGYQPFLLYGLAKLEDLFHELILSNDGTMAIVDSTIGYLTQDNPANYAIQNKFAWSYNPVGIEMAYILQVFGPHLKLTPKPSTEPTTWLNLQFRNHFDEKKAQMQKKTDDPHTLAARLYEATRLRDYPVSVG
jgi:hypothetical protein